jgi:hypothetical protein|nr:MAG TPA: C2H2 type zinc-finger protein [Caudoviricetes sp.]
MIKTLGSVKNIPMNIQLDSLFQYESGEGYRCMYPDTLQGYPTSTPGYLFILKRKNYGEMIYITKNKVYRKSYYILTKLGSANLKPLAKPEQMTDWEVITLSNDHRSSGIEDTGLFRIDEIVELVRKYLTPFDDTWHNREIDKKLTRATLVNDYMINNGDDVRNGPTWGVGTTRINSGRGHLNFKRPHHLRYYHRNGQGTRVPPETLPAHVPFRNENNDYNNIVHMYNLLNQTGHASINIIGYHGNYTVDRGVRIGEAGQNHDRSEIFSNYKPVIMGGGIPGWQEVITKDDLTWRMIFDSGAAVIRDWTVPADLHGKPEFLIQCCINYQNQNYEDLEPIRVIPGVYFHAHCFHGAIHWNHSAHCRIWIQFDGDSYPKSHCPVCKRAFGRRRNLNFDGAWSISLRRVWTRC